MEETEIERRAAGPQALMRVRHPLEVDMRWTMTTWVTAALLAGPALAVTYVVNPDGTGDFPTIQAAVDAAVNGDVIELGNGIFRGDGNRDVAYGGKAITIRSQGGPEACIIDCEGSAANPHRGFSFDWFEGPESVLDGVTITNGYMSPGSAVYCYTFHTTPAITRCVFVNNGPGPSQGAGGALYSMGASPSLTDCEFIGNAAAWGGAVCICDPVQTAVFTRCTFVSNTAARGGGIDI